MLVSDFDYNLPPDLIAQQPLERRDASRMLVVDRAEGTLIDACFDGIGDWLRRGDLLVLNDTRVIPARVFGRVATGGRVELLLLRQVEAGVWTALARPGRKARVGVVIDLGTHRAEIIEQRVDGVRLVRFEPDDVAALLAGKGELALPPYIREECRDRRRYQTVYARNDGSVAAPTAGLHFTPELLGRLRDQGVETTAVTLHVGIGTFRPVKTETVERHSMHSEMYELSDEAAALVNRALVAGRRVIGVGTTSVRVLESRARDGRVEPGRGETDLYIYPGFKWQVTGAMLTNFHLPRSTLLMLVSAFAGRESVMAAYEHAVRQRYRFFSFGDAMLIV